MPAGGINIYCMPPFDTMALVHDVGLGAFDAKYKIGFWQWELSSFPVEAESVFELVDEVWTISEFIAKSIRGATSKPVKVIPLPFENPISSGANRNHFGIPENAYAYYFAFDGASFISRKNPLGTIDAFQRAFPEKGDSRVCLVIKTMGMKDDSLWRECLRRSMIDPRIIILNKVYSRDELYSLMCSIDCFVSLHRAEGFGRLIAEAIVAEKQVIASKYSGSMDFLNEENAYLVDGVEIKLLPGDYHFYKRSEWFEPDIDCAAACFSKAFSDKREMNMEGLEVASRRFKSRYNLDVTGCSIKENLVSVFESISDVN